MRPLEGKVAVITGGSSGIGRAAALTFVEQGARVVIGARHEGRCRTVVDEARALGGEMDYVPCDVGVAADVQRLVQHAVDRFGRLDCAFNNAGTADVGAFKPLANYDEREWDATMAVNLRGVWLCMKYELEQMLAQDPKGGAIVNTSSINGLGGAPQAALYSAAKAGVLALTKSAAQEYGAHGVRVNALVAGAFDTPMLDQVFDRSSGGDAEARQVLVKHYTGMTALGRVGHPREAAAAAAWLCSDAASYVTGHSMIVDGGMTASVR